MGGIGPMRMVPVGVVPMEVDPLGLSEDIFGDHDPCGWSPTGDRILTDSGILSVIF